MFLVQLLTERWSRRAGAPPGTAGVAARVRARARAGRVRRHGDLEPALAPGRGRADTFALELTREPRQFIDLERRLAVANVADPDPPKRFVWLFGTHPPTIERIGAGVAFERSQSGAPDELAHSGLNCR